MVSDRRRSRTGIALALAALLGGCATTGSRRGDHTAQSYFVAPGQSATHYTTAPESSDAVRGPLASALARGIADAQDKRGSELTPDSRLCDLAELVAGGLDERGSPPPYAVIELWTRHLGLPDPTPHLIVLGQSDAGGIEQRVAGEIERLMPEQRYTHYGAFSVEQDGILRVVLALSWRWAELQPVPRSIAPGGKLVLKGRLEPNVRAPQLVVTHPDGTSERSEAGTKPTFEFAVTAPQRGEYRVELLAVSRLGTTVVANFPVYVGMQPPKSIEIEPTPAEDGELAADEVVALLLSMTNRDRAQAGLHPLELDDQLGGIALAHSQDMQANGFVGHTSPTTGSAADRVARAGVRTPLVLENIGRGYGPAEVHRGLMDSPGHRANILSPDATHVGIGVLAAPEDDRTAYLVTELYIRRAAKIDVDDAPEELLEAINAARGRRGARPLVFDTALASLAGETARAYFDAPPSAQRQQFAEQLNRKAASTRRPYTRIASLLAVVTALDEATALDALLDPKARAVGLGVDQGTRPDGVENAIAVAAVIGY